MSDEVDETGAAEELIERAAAIDVAKGSAMVCVRLPRESGGSGRVQRVWNVAATTAAILELGDQLVCEGVQRIVMEATGTYWKPFFFILEARGLECWLVNARDVKNVPGRPKTDRLDAVWLCKLNERGMLRPSFVPPKPVRQLRDLTRTRTVLTEERSRHKQRIEKLLEDAQIRLSSVASDIFGLSGRAMLEAMAAGERDPKALAALARGKMIPKREALAEALTGQFEEHHAFLVRVLLDSIDHLTAQIDKLSTRISTALAQLPMPEPNDPSPSPARAAADLVAKLDEIPGVGPITAQILVAELGPDMTVFPTPGHLASWAKLSPRTIQSGSKSTSGPTGKGNPWLKAALGEAAMAASRTDTFLGARYRRIVKHRGHKKALVAVARSILVIIWNLINDPGARYIDLGADHHQRKLDPAHRTRELVHQLHALGHEVLLTPAG